MVRHLLDSAVVALLPGGPPLGRARGTRAAGGRAL